MFLNDKEKMADFNFLTKTEFLNSYSYLDEREYDQTAKAYDDMCENLRLIKKNMNEVKYCTENLKKYKTVNMSEKEFMNLVGKCRESNCLMSEIKNIIDKIIVDGLESTYNGNWIINLDESKEYSILKENMRLVEKYLKSREEICDIEITRQGLDIIFYLDYCKNIEKESYESLERKINKLENHLLYKGIAITILDEFQNEGKNVTFKQIINATDKVMEQDGAWQNLEECITSIVCDEIKDIEETEEM